MKNQRQKQRMVRLGARPDRNFLISGISAKARKSRSRSKVGTNEVGGMRERFTATSFVTSLPSDFRQGLRMRTRKFSSIAIFVGLVLGSCGSATLARGSTDGPTIASAPL